MRNIFIIGLFCSMVLMSGCRKKYVSPLETPSMTKAPEDKAYEFDFDQMNNSVIESLQEKGIYSFLKDLDVSGDNEKKEIVLSLEVEEDVSYDALELLLTDATKAIVEDACTQDFRIDNWDQDGFGNLFGKYSYHYVVKSGETVVREEEFNEGDSLPFDPGMSLEQVVG